MKNHKKYGQFLSVFLLLANLFSIAKLSAEEPYFSIRTKTIYLQSDTFCMDSIRFLPSDLLISKGDILLVKNLDYKMQDGNSCIVFDSAFLGSDITLTGRVFDASKLEFRKYNKNPLIIEPEFAKNPFIYSTTDAQGGNEDLFRESGLNVMGNISRGVGVGNTQDLILSSDLNLQITGKIGDEINVVAAINDQNNPIQPEGNTQQIQDFDQVYISFFKDSTRLTVGDFLMERTQGDYFKKYYKKSRGFQFEHKQDSVFGGVNYSRAEMAVSRGKFARNEIQGEEGNQGPYRLSGPNGEIFIMIIAGTEAVYVDGKLLERGQQNDYVIDYNTGEIIFMPKVLINQFSRIIIEFQFADRNYARSVINLANVYEKGKVRLRGGFFSEQDNRNQPFQQSLDLFDSTTGRSARDVLSEAGDNPMLAAIPNVTRFRTFQPDRIMYRQLDTLGTRIYQYTDNPQSDTAFYAVTFTRVGQGNGNYRQLVNLANGRVFEYVIPVGGIPQGEYEPVVRLIAPERLQMFTTGIDWQADSNTLISLELASSNEDKNRFSALDASDNSGVAAFFSIDRKDQFAIKNKEILWNNRLSLEWADKNFKYVERYRDVEFERSWSRQYQNPTAIRAALEERIVNFAGTIDLEDKMNVRYKLAHYEKGNEFSGNQGGGGISGKYKGFSFSQDVLFIQADLTKTDPFGASFLQQNKAYDVRGNVSQRINKNASISFDYLAEQSLFELDTSDVLDLVSFRYNQVGLGYQHQISDLLTSNLQVNRRTDFQPKGENMEASVASNNISLNLEKEGRRWQDRLIFTLSYRDIEQLDTVIEDLPERTILSRVEYQINFLKRAIVSNTYYQIGTGREQRREFTYIEVPPGRGTHTWNDYNDNGVQEINEFEPALFTDQANFIKVMIPTNEFIRSNTNEFNQTIKITSPIKWQSQTGFKKFLSRFSSISSYRADRRMTDNNLSTILNPFELSIADTSLINLSSLAKATVFFNRSNPKFGFEYNFQKNALKQFLIQGFDSREVQKNSGSVRLNLSREWSLITQGELGRRNFISDFAPTRNFIFDFSEVHPTLLWQPGNSFRVGGFYKYYEAFNTPEFGGEKAYWSEVGSEFRAFLKNLTTIDGKISYVNIRYTGDSFSPVAWDMLRGLQNGRNFNWTVLVGGKIGKNIQLTINYEGRSSENAPVVHIGRAEARYLF